MSATATLERGTHTYTASDGKRVSLCVSDVLRLSGITQPYPDNPMVMNFVEHARELGTRVHEWCDYLDEGGLLVADLEDSELLPYVTAYQRFREKHQPGWIHVEDSFTKDECAGTPDRIGSILYRDVVTPVIIDIKTPKKAEKHWQIQLSGYQWMTGALECRLFALHLASDASFKLRPYESDIPTWEAALTVAKWRIANGGKIRV